MERFSSFFEEKDDVRVKKEMTLESVISLNFYFAALTVLRKLTIFWRFSSAYMPMPTDTSVFPVNLGLGCNAVNADTVAKPDSNLLSSLLIL